MGRAKELWLEQLERGYGDVDGDICAECVCDPYLHEWVNQNVAATECTFCGRSSDEPIAASFEDFVGVVLGGIHFDWNHPDSEGIMYITAEGGYQAEISTNWDVLYDYEISENDDIFEALIDAIDDNGWVAREFYVGDESQRLEWGWESFKWITKHQTRYLFLKAAPEERDDLPASKMLDVIADVITGRGPDLIKIVAPDTEVFRVRIGGENFATAGSLGPPA